MSTWQGAVSGWSSAVGGWFDRAGETVSGHAKSVLLSLVDWLPFKQASPFSTALLKHYVERSGDPYTLVDIPRALTGLDEAALRLGFRKLDNRPGFRLA
jgi:hypothetical protein